ncbi:MAG: response regulator [Chloroflexi bacterium]|nr:MAG: response regulator [Chloroflexota bacterium]
MAPAHREPAGLPSLRLSSARLKPSARLHPQAGRWHFWASSPASDLRLQYRLRDVARGVHGQALLFRSGGIGRWQMGSHASGPAATAREVIRQMSTTARPDKTVLVVEDDPWIRSLMADLLAGEGYSVVQASDGKAGLEMAEQNDPDVILLDLAMPEKSGLDVLHELKSSKPTRDIPVIVVSAYAMLMMGSDARRADGVIQKPFDLADLLMQVEQAATKRRQTAS